MPTISIMFRTARQILITTCVAGLFAGLCAVQTSAQTIDDGTLYFPPKLNISASTDPERVSRMLNSRNGVWNDTLNKEGTGRIRFTRKSTWKSCELLPIIFFDQASSVIPSRYLLLSGAATARDYTEDAEPEISEDGLYDEEHPKYYDLLNVLGSRMADFPMFHIALEGGFSAETGETPELAAQRAEVVREYLANVWRIDTSRIALLPPRQMCTLGEHVFTQEEARRVTIRTPFLSLLRPVDYRKSNFTSSMIFFNITLDTQIPPSQVEEIELVAAVDGEVLGRTPIPVSPDSSVYRHVGVGMLGDRWREVNGSVLMQAFVTSAGGHIYTSEQLSIPVEHDDLEETEKTTEGGESEGLPDHWRPLLFFEAGDSCLTPLQEQLLEDRMASMAAELQAGDSGEIMLDVNNVSIQAENPGSIIADLVAGREEYRSVYSAFYDAMNDPSFQNSLYLLPPAEAGDEDKKYVPTITSGMMEAWYGEHADIAGNMMVIGSQHGQLRPRPGSNMELMTARKRTIVQQLRERFGPSIPDSVGGSLPTWSTANTHLPETRFYSRSISINMFFAGTGSVEGEQGKARQTGGNPVDR